MKLLSNLLRNSIIPICVFDGKVPDLKRYTIDKKKCNTKQAIKKCEELENLGEDETEEYLKNYKRSLVIGYEIIDSCKKFVKLAGLPVVDSVGEADPQCVAIYHYYGEQIEGIMSEDSDILNCGGTRIIRDFCLKDKTYNELYLDDMIDFLQQKANFFTHKHSIENLTVTFGTFLDFSIIMGNDYCGGIRGSKGNIGRNNIFELFVLSGFDVPTLVDKIYDINKSSGTIVYYVSDKFLEKWKQVRDYYLNVQIIPPSHIDLEFKTIDIDELNKFIDDFGVISTEEMNVEFKDKFDTFISINNYIYDKLVVKQLAKICQYEPTPYKIQYGKQVSKKIEICNRNIFLKLME